MSIAAGLIGAGIGGVAKGIGSLIGGNTQAAAYRDAAEQANNTLSNTYNGIVANETPYTSAGSGAINKVNSDLQNGTGFAKSFNLSDFYSDPGYQFTLQQGTNAVNNSAAAKGGLLSGAATKSLASYTSGLANQTFGDAYNRYLQTTNQQYNQLMGVASLGQTATGQVNNAGLNTGMQQAQNTFNAISGAGNAQAAGYSGLATGLGSAATGTLAQYYSQLKPSTFTGYSSGSSIPAYATSTSVPSYSIPFSY